MALGRSAPEKIDFEVIETPKAAPQLDLSAQKPPPKPQPEKKPVEAARKVFGVSRNAITSDEPGPGVDVKQGNTVATAPDEKKLNDSDATSLPIPTDEYLVSKMPSVAAEVRIPYPPEAREKKIEGKVVMELLIDAEGKVRSATVLSGPGFGLNEAALEAIYRFKFKPAEVDGKPVAVKIPYTYNFVLASQ